MAGYKPRWFTRLETVTHPSTNRARHRATSLIETSALPLGQVIWLSLSVRNVTVSMHIHMVMVVEHHIDVTRLDSLHSLIIDHVSSWMLIEPHYVSVVKVRRRRVHSVAQ